MSAFVAQIAEPMIQDFYALWRAQCQGNLPPYKADFRLDSLPHKMWPHLLFYDYTDDKRFFCIHNGTAVVRYFRTENTGYYLEDFISTAFAGSVVPLYEGVVERGIGVYYRGDLVCSDEGFHIYSRMLLPIRAASGENRHIIGIMVSTGEEKFFNRKPDIQRRNIIWDEPATES